MNKARLKNLKKLISEAEHLEADIRDLECVPKEFVTDTYRDYKTGYPKTKIMSGYGDANYVKLCMRLYAKLSEIQAERLELESWLDNVRDPETRTILRMQYINGMTQEQLAEQLGYTRAAIAMKIKRFWDGESVTDCYK